MNPNQQEWTIPVDSPLQAALDDPNCPQFLRRTLTGSLSWQTRNMLPVGKSLKSPRLAPRWVAALLALGAEISVAGEREPLTVPLQRPAETLHARVGGETRYGAAHVARTPADEPIVAAAVALEIEDDTVRRARVALTGVWPEPVRLAQAAAQLEGGPLSAERIQAAAESVEKEVAPRADFRGSVEYRRAMAGRADPPRPGRVFASGGEK